MNTGIVGRVKGSGGRYRIHLWLPEGDFFVQACMTGSAVQRGLLLAAEPTETHPLCLDCPFGDAPCNPAETGCNLKRCAKEAGRDAP